MNQPEKTDPTDVPVFEPDMDASYTLDVTAEMTGVSSTTILRYREEGLIPQAMASESGELHFNDDALRRLRRIEYLRTTQEISESGIRLVCDLVDEIERLQADLRLRR